MEHKFILKASLYGGFKRLLDSTLALAALLVLAPLFVIIMLILKVTDIKAPIFFSQTRLGKDAQPFTIYKFRTMHINAEQQIEQLLAHNEVKGAMFKMKRDPRVTKVGAFLRATSIDEFPQLINVLKGEMALVGPRPPLPREVAIYSPYELKRLTVTPGCTGLWQVSGRNELDFSQMVELDLQYIRERSLALDIKILMKTVAIIIGERNGY